MTEQDRQTTTAGSARVPQQGSAGSAGLSREVPKLEYEPSGTAGAGRGKEDPGRAKRIANAEPECVDIALTDQREQAGPVALPTRVPAQKTGPVLQSPRPAERVTALHGPQFGRPPEPKSVRRRRTLLAVWDRNGEIPYLKYETASREIICSLMERQDRMNEAIFERLLDLECRISDMEDGRDNADTGKVRP
jgi:hypothetical protein